MTERLGFLRVAMTALYTTVHGRFKWFSPCCHASRSSFKVRDTCPTAERLSKPTYLTARMYATIIDM